MVSEPKDPMLSIWEQTAQVLPDGKKYIIWRNRFDLDYLYITGFVDVDRHSKDEWFASFDDSLKPDGSYQVTPDQWLAKRKYRYVGPVGEAFDPLSLREGDWEPEELEKLLKETILPATTVAEEHFRKGFDKVRNTAFVGGKFRLNRVFKFSLKQLFLNYPSPRRLRELAVAEAREQIFGKRPAAKAPGVSPGVPAKSQSSGYQQGPSKERTTADQLSRLLWKGPK